MDALKNSQGDLRGSRLYFIRIDENDQLKEAGDPYCTICSKMALDAEIEGFTLLKFEGITVYKTEEYNDISFNFQQKS